MARSLVLLYTLFASFAAAPAEAGWLFSDPENAGAGVNTEFSENGAALSADGLALIFASSRPGGEGNFDLYEAIRPSTSDPFGPATNLGPTLNSAVSDLGGGISVDGLTLFFVSTRDSPNGQGDLFSATRASTSDPWETPTKLAVSSNSDDANPEISSDGLTLYFQSLRSGGFGDYDLWAATRSGTSDPFGSPFNLGPDINSAFNDGGPSVSSDNLSLFFSSNRPGGLGGATSMWVATRSSPNDPFSNPTALTVNSGFDGGQPHISRDGTIFVFQSDRPGGFGSSDI